MFRNIGKMAIFIDGSNVHATARALKMNIDYAKLYRIARDKNNVFRMLYYSAIRDEEEFSPIRPLLDYLVYNGYSVVSKPTKEYHNDEGVTKIKGNMDLEIAVDMLNLSRHVEHIVLFSGDGDFRYVVDTLQRNGSFVTVVSSIKTNPVMVADELRRQADEFIELSDLAPYISRERNGS